jgi:hypothetical protein
MLRVNYDDIVAELRARGRRPTVEPDAKFAKYRGKPVEFVQEVLGYSLWSKQQAVLLSTTSNRRTAVHSCHDSGKSFILAATVAYWLSVYPPGEAFVVTTAPTFNQVRAILWREINSMHAAGHLPGTCSQVEWSIDGKLVAMGRKPDDYSPGAFQGIHALRVLVVIDEACAVAASIWDAAETLITNDESAIVAIGNPDDPDSRFRTVCDPGSGWHVIHIDGMETPNFTDEPVPDLLRKVLLSRIWAEERAKAWGEDSPIYISKVRGRFPDQAESGLIPVRWIMAAFNRYRDTPGKPGLRVLGVDVGGGTGNDKTVIYLRDGDTARLVHEDNTADTMLTASRIAFLLREHRASLAVIDSAGLGKGVYDRCRQLGVPSHPVNVGEGCDDDTARAQFENKRAHFYWSLRDRFEKGELRLDPTDDIVEGQLRATRYKLTPRGRIAIESKDDMAKRGLRSPDHADALMLCFAPSVNAAAPLSGAFGGLSLGSRVSAWVDPANEDIDPDDLDAESSRDPF